MFLILNIELKKTDYFSSYGTGGLVISNNRPKYVMCQRVSGNSSSSSFPARKVTHVHPPTKQISVTRRQDQLL